MRRRLVFSALAGVCFFLGYAGFGIWPLAFFAFTPLLFALEGATARQGLWLGWAFGLVTNAGGYYWLVGTIRDFGGFPVWLAVPFQLVLSAWQGGQFALTGWLFARARERGAPLLLALAAAVATGEMVWPLLFPFYLGNALHDATWFVQIADLGGPMLVSAVLVVAGAGLYRAVRPPRRFCDAGIGAAAVAVTLGYGAFRVAEIDRRSAAAPALEVGLVQVSMGIFEKDDNPLEGVRRHVEQSLALEREHRPDLIVWPESGYNLVVPQGADNVRRAVAGDALSTPLLFGGLRREHDAVDRVRLFNSAFLLDRDGRTAGTYDKTYLLMFGEYLPFGEIFPKLYDWSPHTGRFAPGSRLDALPFGPWRLGVLICYEDILPAFVRKAVRHGDPHLLVNLTNDAWFGDSVEPWIHLALAQSRAVEQRRWLVRSTNSGVSALIDPVGRVVAHTGVFTRENLAGTVRLMTGGTVYRSLGDWPGWLGLGLAAYLALRRPRESPGSSRGPSAMRRSTLAVLLAAGPATAGPVALEVTSGAVRTPLVELFTSEGCSSCPPAERALAELIAGGTANAAALAFHVTYWDHLGWRDRFAERRFDRRQEAYARRAAAPSIYTPQFLVDGADAGGRRGLAAALERARGEKPAADVALRLEWEPPGRALLVFARATSRGGARPGEPALLHVAIVEHGLKTAVAVGENAGRTLRHDGVARALPEPARCPAGGAECRLEARVELDGEWNSANLGAAAWLQGAGSLGVRQAVAGRLAAPPARRP